MEIIKSSNDESRTNWARGLFSVFCAITVIVVGYMWALCTALSFDSPGYCERLLPAQKALYRFVMGVVIPGTIISDTMASALLIIGGLLIIWNRRGRLISQVGVYISLISGASKIAGSILCVSIWMSLRSVSLSFQFLGELLLLITGYPVCPLILFIFLRRDKKLWS